MRGIKHAIQIILCLFMGFSALHGDSMNHFSRLIPKKIGTWEVSRADTVYNRETLYEYMNGGAEVYLAFHFSEVFSRMYGNPGGIQITMDIYDMGSPAEAFGIFSCDRADPDAGIGQESEYGFGLLRYWQGRYFVTITAGSDDAETEKTVLDLGRAVLPHLGAAAGKSSLVESLPTQNLIPHRTSYFHSNVSLNNRFFIASENILHLDSTTDCAIAEYKTDSEENAILLAVHYSDADAARAACDSFVQVYLPELKGNLRGRTEKRKWISVKVCNRLLTILFEAPSFQWADEFESAIKIPCK